MNDPTFDRLLVANRGEIACRVFRTCRAMGLRTVAVYSEADRAARHVREADDAIRVGPAPSAASYLDQEAILDACRRTGAGAVHPGYGFLSENPDFARRVGRAGLVWIGPPPAAIEKMGLKDEAKRIVEAAGVPVIPGFQGAGADLARLADEARRIGFPLLVKAVAGGGGKGMRIVPTAADLTEALEGARRDAGHAFGNDALFLERFVPRSRHIEFQILADGEGRTVHVFERECSLQRRYQKIVEETPSVLLDDARRSRMGEAAVAAARAVGYVGAGTIEFLVDADEPDRFYFLEMNTRLQVEHPVTEMTTGLDLVREQIRIARGEPLGYGQGDLTRTGHAIECRLYAEDPADGFRPAPGRVLVFEVPDEPGVRVDSGVESGDEVSIHYDPLLAKVVTWGNDRSESLGKMRRTLGDLVALGTTTNQAFLLDLLAEPAVRAGEIDTRLVETRDAGPPDDDGRPGDAALLAVLADVDRRRTGPGNPWPFLPPGWSNSPGRSQVDRLVVDGRPIEVAYRTLGGDRLEVAVGARAPADVRILSVDGRRIALEVDGRRLAGVVAEGPETTDLEARWFVHLAGRGPVVVERPRRFPLPGSTLEKGAYVAPMPGGIRKILVAVGQAVAPGAGLVLIEAMKMENTVVAHTAGVVREVRVAVGDQVENEQLLLLIDEGNDP